MAGEGDSVQPWPAKAPYPYPDNAQPWTGGGSPDGSVMPTPARPGNTGGDGSGGGKVGGTR